MQNLKLLYLSCHSILEYDEIKLFHEIGIDVFSHGAYLDPNNPEDALRPGFPGKRDDRMIELARKYSKEKLDREIVEPFDAVMIMHIPRWVVYNWDVIKDKIVIWRSIGQSCESDENSLRYFRQQGMKIVRYSPMESAIPGYLGEDAVIRFYKDPDEYKNWSGPIPQIITFGQSMVKRGKFMNYDIFVQSTEGFRRKLYGPHNEDAGKISGGFLPSNEQKQVLRDSRAYFHGGTTPACYTLSFVEAFMTGIPIVAVGQDRGNASYLPGQYTYEIHNIIENGKSGFISDDIDQMRKMIKLLMDRKDVADYISENARKRAIELFGKEKIKQEWINFFNSL